MAHSRRSDVAQMLERHPRADLACQPTPLQEMPALSRLLGGQRLLVKRDDLTGLAFGGNKARKLEYIMADALAKDADIIVTSAAAQSNMLRQTSAAARILGMDVHLVMRGTGQEAIQGNLLLDHLFGAEITFIPTTDPYSTLSLEVMARVVQDLRRAGRNPYVIDLRYESGALATLGYVRAAVELQQRLEELGIDEAIIACPTGSGSTQAGLVLGAHLLEAPWRVLGVSVQQPAMAMLPRIARKVQEAAALLGIAPPVDPSIVVDDRWIGPGYGAITPECIEAIQLGARLEGLVLDPVYSGKGLAGLIGRVREGSTAGPPVVFIHTGGTPAVFAYAGLLAPALAGETRQFPEPARPTGA